MFDSGDKVLTHSERKILKALCKIGLNADGELWSNYDIDAAISSIKVEEYWPTAYKTYNSGEYLD